MPNVKLHMHCTNKLNVNKNIIEVLNAVVSETDKMRIYASVIIGEQSKLTWWSE